MRRALTRSSARASLAISAVVALAVLTAAPAGACGGLVGENGTIELVRTTTLSAYHDGVQRYVTSFEFTGQGEEVGSIVPLPDIPTDVVRGGDWTLQRLAQEVRPPEPQAFAAETASASRSGAAEVLLERQIDALDITVLRGGGDEVGRWAREHGFLLTPDAPEVLDFYADRSPIFMAARFDASRAAELGQQTGDGTPIMVTIPTDAPWVPLRILGLGLDADRVVEADVFVLTDERPQLLAGGPGLTLNRSEPASSSLLADLRSDVGMEWVPASMWLTHLPLESEAGELTYDLAISTDEATFPSVADAGIDLADATPIVATDDRRSPWPLALGLLGGAGVVVALTWRGRRAVRPTAPA